MDSRSVALLIGLFLAIAAPASAQEVPLFQPPPEQPVEIPGPPHVDVGIGENTGTFFGDPASPGRGSTTSG